MLQRLPIPGQDDGTWGSVLNGFLQVAHNPDGTLQSSAITTAGGYIRPSAGIPASDLDTSTQTSISSVASKYVKPPGGIPSSDLTSAVQASLANANSAIQSINGKTGASITLGMSDLADANITSPADGQVLTYNSTSSKWKNQAAPSAAVSSVFGRTGAVTAQSGDYTAAQVGALPSTDDLSAIASANATAGNISMNSHKITNLTLGSQPNDAAAFSQIPTASTGITNTGGAWSVAYGTTSATAAAGNDARITGAIQSSVVTAKGDMLAATASGAITNVAAGGNGTFLTADSTQPAGVKWGTLTNQAGPVINVKDATYGAKGDGSTNDTTPIQNAINAANTAGAVVYFPAGQYRVSQLTLLSGTILRGVSSGTYPGNNTISGVSVLQRIAGTNLDLLLVPDGNNYGRIYDLAIDGNKNNNSSGYGLNIADGASGQESQWIVERCFFHDNPSSNIYLGANRRANKILNSICNYSGSGDGITVAGSDNTVQGNICGSNSRAGICLGTTITQNWAASSPSNAAAVAHVVNNDIYGNQVGVAIAASASDCIVAFNGVDRHTSQGITVYNGTSNAIVGNSFHSNGTGTHNTYAHIDVGSGVTSVVIDDNNFGPLDSGVTNIASYAVNVPGTTNRVYGNMGIIDPTSTVGGLTNSTSNAQPWVTLSSAGATIQSSGNDILNLRNTSGTLVTKLTNGGSFVHSGGGVQFTVNANHVFGASSPIGSSANLLSLVSSNAAISPLATQNASSQTANIATFYASDGSTVLAKIDKSGGISVLGNTGATATSRYAGATTGGAPASGTFAVGDFVIDQTGKIWICTAAGSPGTWTAGSSGATVDNSTTPQKDGTVGAAGNSSSASPANHVHPRNWWTPEDHGLVTWSMDVVAASANSIMQTAGTLYLARVHVPVAATATNLLLATTASATLTSGQCFASLYTAAGTLVGSTADQSTNWSSTGLKTMALSGGPFALAAGDYYIGLYANGTTLPTLARGNSQIGGSFLNAGMSSGYRFATANTGLTTTPPSTLGALSSSNFSWWLAIS